MQRFVMHIRVVAPQIKKYEICRYGNNRTFNGEIDNRRSMWAFKGASGL